MESRHTSAILFRSAATAAIIMAPLAAHSQRIWYVPGEDGARNGIAWHQEFPKLFEEPPAWPTGLKYLDVLQFDTPYLIHLEPARLDAIHAFLARHPVEVSVAMSLLPVENCGGGIEGLTSLAQVTENARLLSKLGIQITYVFMDEPLFYGHDYSGPGACRLPITEVAIRLSQSISAIRAYFPHQIAVRRSR